MSEVPTDWLDQAARREADEQARASALGTNTTTPADPRTVLRDRIAAELADVTYRGRQLTTAHARALADAVMELFCDVRPSPWLRAGYVIADIREGDRT